MKALFVFQKVILVSLLVGALATVIPALFMMAELILHNKLNEEGIDDTMFVQIIEALYTSYEDW
jgi:hypothetical protein